MQIMVLLSYANKTFDTCSTSFSQSQGSHYVTLYNATVNVRENRAASTCTQQSNQCNPLNRIAAFGDTNHLHWKREAVRWANPV